MRDINEIIDIILNNEDAIIEKLDKESVDVYKFLQNQFKNNDVTKNYLFQFVFRSYYRLDNAGLKKKWKERYFEIMQDNRSLISDKIMIVDIIEDLYNIETEKGLKSIQFSFITKLIHTIDNSYPIYDSNVASMFGFRAPYELKKEQKIERYLNQHKRIFDTYNQILADDLLERTFNRFDERFSDHDIYNIMKIDFIFWAGGKVLQQ